MPLTSEETAVLLSEYSRTHDIELRNRIVEAYAGLAAKTARHFARPGMEFDDLFQVAQMALIKAADRFEAGRGLQFSTFATPTLVGEVKNYIRDHSSSVHMPRTVGEQHLKFKKAEQKLSAQLGRAPTAQEIANEMGLSLERTLEVMEAGRNTNVMSIDTFTEDEAKNPVYRLGMTEAGYDRVEREQLMRSIFAQLDEEEKQIITLRFFKGLTQSETGKKLGQTQMYISRKERRILERLRAHLREDD